MIGGDGIGSPLCNLFLIYRFESLWKTLFGLFYSPSASMGLHVREPIKNMICILNQNRISLSFLESWLFNMISYLGLVGGLGFKLPFCNLFLIG